MLGDIRDVIHDVQNWESSWKHVGKTALDLVGLLPLVGSIKYVDEGTSLLKHSDEAANALKNGKKASDITKGTYKSSANNVADFERYISSLAAKEIVNAERVGTALSKSDPGHRAASLVSEETLAAGRTFSMRGGDGVKRTLLQTKGELNGNSGIYEYMLEPNGQVSHQRFIRGGIINSMRIKL